MKMVHTSIIATVVFFLSAGMSFGAELDDLDITIRMVESDDLTEMHNELSLPDAASDTAREHAEDEGGRGLTQANDVREKEHEQEEELRDEHEDQVDDHDNAHEDDDDLKAEHDEAHEEETHEAEHDATNDGVTP